MKKILSIILTVLLIISVCPLGLFSITASAETATSGTTGDCTWSLDGTVLTISGNGEMADYNYYISDSVAPWGTDITEVIIGNGVTSIGTDAFCFCESLTTMTIPNSVTTIKDAFWNCTSLNNIYITDIATWCNIDFASQSSNPLDYNINLYLNEILVTDLVIPNTVTEIKKYAFCNTTSLTSVIIPDSVTSIGKQAFDGCTKLTDTYYVGTDEQWANIEIGSSNDCLKMQLYTTTVAQVCPRVKVLGKLIIL